MMGSDKVEKLSRPASAARSEWDWERLVWQRYRNQCANCGSKERLAVRMVVPPEAGGQKADYNGILLCRSCEMAADAVKKGKKDTDQRLVNFWMSRALYERINTGIDTRLGFSSMGSLIRYMVERYVLDPDRFEDLELYQDADNEVKVHIWIDKELYFKFKAQIDQRNMTVTDAIKALVICFEVTAEVNIQERS
jgi:hypothetical protein